MSSSKRSSSSAAAEKAAAAKAKEEAAKAKEELVKAMSDPAKADLLSQALLREYMHRKGFKKTLASFDKENPRTETTINSRELMNNLLSAHIIQKRNSSRKEPFATIMEVLCSYRLRKREVRGRRGINGAEGTPSPNGVKLYAIEGPDGDGFDSSDEEKELRLKASEHSNAIQQRSETNAAAEEAYKAAVAKAAAEKPKENKNKKEKASKEKGDAEVDAGTGKKKKKSKEEEEPAPVTRVGRGFDPLGLAKTSSAGSSSSGFLTSSLGISGAHAPSGMSSRRMVPGDAPAVGLAKDTSSLFNIKKTAAEEEESSNYKPPSFVAGEGFKLSTNSKKVSAPTASEVWGSDKKGSGGAWGVSTSPSGGRMSSTEREEVPSPYANLGQVKFDANAQAKSVLSNGNKGSGGGRRITWGDSNSEPSSEVGTPVTATTKVGFGFNTKSSSESPPGPNRARRTVTIIDQ